MALTKNFIVHGLASILLLGSLSLKVSQAATISWTNWASATSGNPGSATGTISGSPSVSVTYSGQTSGLLTNYPSWAPTASYTGGTVSNAPPAADNAVALTGGTSTTNTITFSSTVVNPILAIWSLGAGGTPASFNFLSSEPFTIEAGGPSAEYGGRSITSSGNNILGSEGNGVVQFNGTFSSISWTNPSYENYYAFTFGIAGVATPTSATPEPNYSLVVLIALAGWMIAHCKYRPNRGATESGCK